MCVGEKKIQRQDLYLDGSGLGAASPCDLNVEIMTPLLLLRLQTRARPTPY